jgi:hypothetical protein
MFLASYCTFYVTLKKTRDDLYEEMLQEPDEIALKRKRCSELWQAYQQAFKVDNHKNTSAKNVDVLSKFHSLMNVF